MFCTILFLFVFLLSSHNHSFPPPSTFTKVLFNPGRGKVDRKTKQQLIWLTSDLASLWFFSLLTRSLVCTLDGLSAGLESNELSGSLRSRFKAKTTCLNDFTSWRGQMDWSGHPFWEDLLPLFLSKQIFSSWNRIIDFNKHYSWVSVSVCV